jgi:hypothetical protein
MYDTDPYCTTTQSLSLFEQGITLIQIIVSFGPSIVTVEVFSVCLLYIVPFNSLAFVCIVFE